MRHSAIVEAVRTLVGRRGGDSPGGHPFSSWSEPGWFVHSVDKRWGQVTQL